MQRPNPALWLAGTLSCDLGRRYVQNSLFLELFWTVGSLQYPDFFDILSWNNLLTVCEEKSSLLNEQFLCFFGGLQKNQKADMTSNTVLCLESISVSRILNKSLCDLTNQLFEIGVCVSQRDFVCLCWVSWFGIQLDFC